MDEAVTREAAGQAADRAVLAGRKGGPTDREGQPAEPSRDVRPKTIALTPALTRAPASRPPLRRVEKPQLHAPCQLLVLGSPPVPQRPRIASTPPRPAAAVSRTACRAQLFS